MEEQEFIEKVDELKEHVNRLIDEKAEKLLKSGIVDLENYETNFILPKLFISAIGNEINFQFKPLSWNFDLEKEIKNISLYF